MAKVSYKQPSSGMERMLVKPEKSSRPSLGMTEVKGEIYYFNVDDIIPYKNQARKDMDEKLLDELAVSIQSQGIIQPLQIILSQEIKGKFEVVSGERRFRAARKIGLQTVPCIILDRDRDADEIALIENIQREALHPIELADAIARLLKGPKYENQVEIAEKIGVSKQQISHLLAIARLPEDIKNHLIKKKDVKIDFLKKISYLKDEEIMREKVFHSSQDQRKFLSILRMSSNGETFRFDQLKIEKLTDFEKGLLKKELYSLLEKLDI